eukprot:6856868-Pyramimonas_sp.AAC.2
MAGRQVLSKRGRGNDEAEEIEDAADLVVTRSELDTILNSLRGDFDTIVQSNVKQASKEFLQSTTSAIKKMAEMQDRRFVQLETQMGDLSAKQTALQQDQKEMQASIEKILKIIAEAEASIPTPLPTNGSNWERDLDPTIFKLSCAELFTTTEALKSIEEWIGELGIQGDQWTIEGTTPAKRFALRFKGASGLASRR